MGNTPWKARLKEIFGLRIDQASREEIEQRIRAFTTVTGTNMYILILAILIASIGLNMNSTAVVIGAMLISPLMSLIISIAYAISVRDSQWLKKSVIRFLFQISVSILTSTIYFILTPLDGFSGELAARTHPTIWDVLIAICGGMAAIIANTRKSTVSNVIPGAAIATALMPPLCTVGYCLATAKWLYALGAFYLFSINAIFICLSSIVGFHIMQIAKSSDWLKNRKNRTFLAIVILLAVIPSFFLAWQSVRESDLKERYDQFISHELDFDNTQVVKSEIDTSQKIIRVAMIGSVLDNSTLDRVKQALPQYDLGSYQLEITQTQVEQGITKEQLDAILSSQQTESPLSNDLEQQLSDLQTVMDVQSKAKELQTNTAKELLLLYPDVQSVGFTEMQQRDESVFTIVLRVKNLMDEDTVKTMQSWMEYKFDTKVEMLQIPEGSQADGASVPSSDVGESVPDAASETASEGV